jgi:enolase
MKLLTLKARQVIDSRGNPTVEVEATSSAGMARAIVPSGASTGVYEAKELRDGGKPWRGKGVSKAVANVNTVIAKAVLKKEFASQAELDNALIKLDGTPDKSKLGANAILGVSMVFTRLQALEANVPLFQHISKQYKTKAQLPTIFANVINGGKHAGNGLAMQEFMVVPQNKDFSKSVEDIAVTYQELKDIIKQRYGAPATAVGDEGGFAPPVQSAEEALELLTQAVQNTGTKMRFAIDAAASEFYNEKKKTYNLPQPRTEEQLLGYYEEIIKTYKVVSLEDPFEQHNFDAFAELRKRAQKKGCQIVGDDLTVTNVTRIQEAIKHNSCSCLLLKINQIGTISEAVAAAQAAQKAKWAVMVSHRSGETEDTFISHLATGLGTGQAKLGAPCRSERVAKYNELLRISEHL